MIDVNLNRNDRTDLYEHLAAEIRPAIAVGSAAPGERCRPRPYSSFAVTRKRIPTRPKLRQRRCPASSA